MFKQNFYRNLLSLCPTADHSTLSIESKRREFILAFKDSYERRGYNLARIAIILDCKYIKMQNITNRLSRRFEASLLHLYLTRIDGIGRDELDDLIQKWQVGYLDASEQSLINAGVINRVTPR